MTNTAATTARRFSNRDRLGRFCRLVNLDQMRAERSFFNDEVDTCHGHANCGNVIGTATEGTVQDGWACAACVQVDVPAWVASRNVATVTGHATCDCCQVARKVRSFPTMVVADSWRVRGTTCRKCVRAGRTPAAPVQMAVQVAA